MTLTLRPCLGLLLAALPLLPTAAQAQEHRFRVGVGGGLALGTLSWTGTSTWEVNQEDATLRADYEAGTGPAVEAMIGVRVTPAFGFRAAFGWSRRDADATLEAAVPHPFFFDRPRPVSGQASGLEYSQLTTYLDLEWRPVVGRLSLSFFGGAALVRAEADVVERIQIDEEFPFDEATFRSAQTRQVRSDAGVGWSAGASLSHVLGHRAAVVLEGRYTRASLELSSSGSAVTPLDAGGFQLIAGLTVGF